MGDTRNLVYLFVLKLILICLCVFLFLIVMLVIIGNAPVMILFTAPGIFLQVMLIIYFWIIMFAVSGKPKSSKKANKTEDII